MSTLEAPPAAGKRNGARTRLIGGICLFFLLIGLLWLVYWFFFLRLAESTDDSYVAGNQIRIAPQIHGSVKEIFADNTQTVAKGRILVRLDDNDARLSLEQARAALAQAVRESRSLSADVRRLDALVEQRRQELEKAQGDFVRRKERKTAMSVSEEELSHARDDFAIAQHALQVAENDRDRAYRLLRDTPLHEQPTVKQAAHKVREAWLALQRCEIRSPADGFVARRTVQVGMQVAPGTPLMAVVPLSEVWVDANFKEVQLKHMRVGQSAVVTADLYGSAAQYKGTVVGFSAGTGSSFSLLPPENATGNWIKVVQRVPVKIALDKAGLEAAPLLVGLSCTTTVDISDPSGPMLAGEPGENSSPIFSTDVQDYDFSAIDNDIENIIRDNS